MPWLKLSTDAHTTEAEVGVIMWVWSSSGFADDKVCGELSLPLDGDAASLLENKAVLRQDVGRLMPSIMITNVL